MSRGNQESTRSPEYQVLIELLKEAWTKSGKTQKQICDELGKPKNYLIKIEKGLRRVDVVEIFKLCKVVKIDPLTLLESFADRI